MAKKVILFGLIANISMLFKDKIWQDAIFIVDNNAKLHGQCVNGLLVVGPEKICEKDYDEILILTWAYSQIKRQLVSLGVPDKKISSVNKRLVTISVFEEMKVREIALRFVSDLCIHAENSGLNLYADAGTLLGIVRDKDLVSWDTDIDFSIIVEDFERALDCITSFSERESPNYKVTLNSLAPGAVSVGGTIVIGDTCVPFDIFTRIISGNLSTSASGEFFSCHARHFTGIDRIEFGSYYFTIPVDYKEYLSSLYGSDWPVPKYNFSYADFNYEV